MMRRPVNVFMLMILLAQFALAFDVGSTRSEGDKVELYFFWGDGCPHCAELKPVLEKLEEKYPQLEVHLFEVYYNKSNLDMLQNMIRAYGRQSTAVPITFIADTMIDGYFPGFTDEKLDKLISQCIQEGCVSPSEKLDRYLNPTTTTLLPTTTTQPPAKEPNEVVVYFFWGDGCPHCAHEKPFLESLKGKYPNLEVRMFETWNNPENAKMFEEMATVYDIRASGVPTTFIGDFEPTIGYDSDDTTGKRIEEEIQYCLENGCINPAKKIPLEKTSVGGVEDAGVCVHVFVTGECPNCRGVSSFLQELKNQYKIDLVLHDIRDEKEETIYKKFKQTYGFDAGGYPTVFIGDVYLIGEKAIRENLEQKINACMRDGCVCPAEKIQALMPYPPQPGDMTPEKDSQITLPVIGEINTSKMSLPAFTILIAGLDSFNPCAFFVLFFLLSMLIHAKSRQRMLLIGGVFVFFSGFIYFLFMAAWLNIFLIIGQLKVITTLAGIVALVVAVINIKEFFYFGRGLSLTIPTSAKPKLFKRMRDLLQASSVYSMMFGAGVLAVSANAYELLCTAGFPMVFTRVLTLHKLSTTTYYLYLALYNLVYVIPLALIVLMFTLTLGARKLTEWEGQVLKLVSGLMMLGLGAVLLINPALLNSLTAGAGLLLASLASALVIIYATGKNREKRGG